MYLILINPDGVVGSNRFIDIAILLTLAISSAAFLGRRFPLFVLFPAPLSFILALGALGVLLTRLSTATAVFTAAPSLP